MSKTACCIIALILGIIFNAEESVMAKTLDSMQQMNWAYGGSSGFARYEFSDDFVDEDGREFEAGPKSYLEVPTTIAGSVVTVPAYPNFPTTENAVLNNGVTVTCHLLDSNRVKRTTLFEDCRIYASLPSVISLSQLVLANGASRILRDTDVWTKEQVIDYVETRPPAAKMTALAYGTGRLSVPAVDPTDPKVVGSNDPRFYAFVSSDYVSLNAAVATIGSTPGVLYVTSANYASGNTCTVPSTLVLDWGDIGSLQVANSQIITIVSDTTAWPVRKLFNNALAGQGAVRFTGSAFSVFPVKWWGAAGNNVADDTTAIQAVIDAIDDSQIFGTVLFHTGVYVVGGALQDTTLSNAQLLLPRRVGTQLGIKLKGEAPLSNLGVDVSTKGAVIRSTLASGTGAVFGAKTSAGLHNRSEVTVYIEDLTVRTIANPTIRGLDLRFCMNAFLRNMKVDVGQGYDLVTQPTTATSYGILMPANNVASSSHAENVAVAGFYTAFYVGELSNFNNVVAVNCYRAFDVPALFHSAQADRILVVNCRDVVVFSEGPSTVHFTNLDIEHTSDNTKWWFPRYDIDDSNNYARGEIGYHLIKAGTGVVHDQFVQNGGFYLWTREIGAANNYYSASPTVQAHNSANISIPDAAWTSVTFNTNLTTDPYALHSTVSNTNRFLCPKQGRGILTFGGQFANNVTGIRGVRAFKHSPSGGELPLPPQYSLPVTGGNNHAMLVTFEAACTEPGDYFYLEVFQSSGGALNLLTSNFNSPFVSFTIER